MVKALKERGAINDLGHSISSPNSDLPPSSSSPSLVLPLRPKLIFRIPCPKTKEQERDVQSTSDDHKAKKTPCKAPVVGYSDLASKAGNAIEELGHSTSSPNLDLPPSSSSSLVLPLRPKLIFRIPCPKTKEQERDVQSTSDDHKANKMSCKAPVVRSGPIIDGVEEDKKKVEFRMSLTREEIDDDFIAMTGKLPRRSVKRSEVEKKPDGRYPGSSLPKTITHSCYLRGRH